MRSTIGSMAAMAQQGLDNVNTLEQIIQRLPFNCRFNTRIGASFRTTNPDGSTTVIHASCHQLRCSTCARVRYHQLTDVLRQACRDHGLGFYGVLTLPGGVAVTAQEERLKAALSRLLQEARRTFGPAKLVYFWALGVGANQNLHFNLLLNTDIRRASRHGRRVAWLKSTWQRLTGAQQLSFAPITAGTHDRVVRYLLIDLLRTVVARPALGRRYGGSRCIKPSPPDVATPEDDNSRIWIRVRVPSATFGRISGQDINPVTNGEYLLPPDFQDALASSTPRLGEPALRRCTAAGGVTAPAAGLAGVGVPVPPRTPGEAQS
jgi:hypothetical protein